MASTAGLTCCSSIPLEGAPVRCPTPQQQLRMNAKPFAAAMRNIHNSRSLTMHCESSSRDSTDTLSEAASVSTSYEEQFDKQQRRPPLRPADMKATKLQKIEQLGEEAWAGVAAVDRGDSSAAADWGYIVLLVAGDAAALMVFAAIGRGSHNEGLDLASTFATALPFLIGWYASAGLLGGYGKAARGGDVGAAAAAAAKPWLVGVPVGLLLRSMAKGYPPALPFVGVSLAATGVLLIGWRAALAAATPEEAELTPAEQLRRRRNKQGNPFEFLQLLFGLVKRW